MVLLFVRGAGRSGRKLPRSKEKSAAVQRAAAACINWAGRGQDRMLRLQPAGMFWARLKRQAKPVQALDAYNAQNTPAARLKCTFADAYAQWRMQPKFEKLSTDMQKGYELAYGKAAPLYDRQLRDLKAADYQQVIDAMVEKGLSRSSCEKQRTLFSQICEWAMAQDIINKNYAMLL